MTTQVDQNREDDGQLAHQATPKVSGNEADNPVEIGDIVSAVTTTYLGTRLWDVRITGINEHQDFNPFSYNNYRYKGETVAGPVTILSKGMIHNNHTQKWSQL